MSLRQIMARIGGERLFLVALMTLGFVHGLVYWIVVPPWQHYDEPSHFEYARWIASNFSFPQAGQVDQKLRREIAASMVEHGFFENLGIRPNLFAIEDPIWIGISQFNDPPGYYLAAALPIALMPGWEVRDQLYAGRGISFLMYLGVLLLSYATFRQLTPHGHPLRWLGPLMITLIPAFSDLMTAMNNDVAATLAFSLYLWLGVRLILKGLDPLRFTAWLVSAALCIMTKTTVWVSVPLSVFLGFLVLLRLPNPRGRLVRVAGLIIFAIGIIFVVERKSAAAWYDVNPQTSSGSTNRINFTEAPLGDSAIQLEAGEVGQPRHAVFQPVSADVLTTLRGRVVSFGGWMWADRPTQALTPALWVDGKTIAERVELKREPVFWSLQTQIGSGVNQMKVLLQPPNPPGSGSTIYFDGLVLTPRGRPEDTPPVFDDPSGQSGRWGSRSFNNLIRNPSIERKIWALHPRINLWFLRASGFNLNHIFTAWQDGDTFLPHLRLALTNLFQSFWARFGWNQIRLARPWYWSLAALTAISLAGAVWGSIRAWRTSTWERKIVIIWLISAGFLVWIGALLRLGLPFFGQSAFIPSARYAYPAMIPTALVLAGGWIVWFGKLTKLRFILAVPVLFLLMLDLVSLQTILLTYRGL